MTPAYYIRYTPGHHGSRDRIGGLPTHLPSEYPICDCGDPFTFLAQLYVDDKTLLRDDTLALHFYECDRCHEQRLLAIDHSASLNTNREGQSLSQLEWQLNNMGIPYSRVQWETFTHWQDISWDARNDPRPTNDTNVFWDADELRPEFQHLGNDKLGGCFPWCDEGGTPAMQLGAIGQLTINGTIYVFNHPETGLFFSRY